MLSYREATTGVPPIDWYQELSACNTYDSERLDRLQQLADTWAHCPVGALSNAISRDEHGIPDDGLLVSLGTDFSYQLYHGLLRDALATWGEIQTRGNILLIHQEHPHAFA